MKGFVDNRVDVVVKFGGSLLADKDCVCEFISGIRDSCSAGKRIVIIQGGGPTDNAIELLDEWAQFHKNTHHHACALAQDQTGLMLADPNISDVLVACADIDAARKVMNDGKAAVILPSKIVLAVDPFERTWDITSDSMSAWFAWLLGSKDVVICTNMDGVYPAGRVGDNGELIPSVTCDELEALGHSAVDKYFAGFVREKDLNAWIINGRYGSRLHEAIMGKSPIGTRVSK